MVIFDFLEEEVNLMVSIFSGAYEALMGNIDDTSRSFADMCIAQCTGCMCNCRCSCSGGRSYSGFSEYEWEAI